MQVSTQDETVALAIERLPSLDLSEQPAFLFFLDRGFPGLCGHGRLPGRCDLPHELYSLSVS